MIVALIAAGVYLGLAGFAFQGRPRGSSVGGWLVGFCLYSLVLMGIHALILGNRIAIPTPPGSSIVLLAGFIVSVGLIGALSLAYVESKISSLIWPLLSIIWIIALIFTYQAPVIGAPTDRLPAALSFQPPLQTATIVMVGGWGLVGLILFLLAARAYLSAELPLVANRVLMWALVAPTLLLGDALSGWFTSPWNMVGYGVRLLGAIGAVYSVVSHRSIDLLAAMRWLVSRSVVTFVTALLILGAILGVIFSPIASLDPALQWVIIIGIALGVATLHQPILALVEWVIRHLGAGAQIDPAEAVRLYSQKINAVIELRELAAAAVKTSNQLLNTRQGYMILAREYQDHVDLEVVGRVWSRGPRALSLPMSSPIYRRLVDGAKPLLQYDIRYQKDLAGISETEKEYFDGLEMDIFAPIINGNRLVGLLAMGPKTNDEPFKAREIELLAALAHQMVTALENARLISDLRSLNEKNRLLNEDLRVMNERLERMDDVKSDFISIASHELRTPLTQIQGYADLIHEMVDRDISDTEQMKDMSSHLVAAAERMAEVLNAMMDVTQIDVENMDMSFETVRIAEAMRTALEPYQEAVGHRKLNLAVSGLDGMPTIEGDSKRLSQLFQNLLSNAIKFTPDGGRVDVSGQILGKNELGEPHSVQITIADSGIGIEKESLQLIFEKFYRVGPVELHSTGATKFKGAGPGLGLAIAKGIVEAHGGRIWVDSPGYDEKKLPGSAFNVVLPIHPPAKDLRNRLQQMEAVGATRSGRATDHFATKPGFKH